MTAPKSEPNRGKQQQKTKYGITREPKEGAQLNIVRQAIIESNQAQAAF